MNKQNRGCLPGWIARIIAGIDSQSTGPTLPKMNINTKFITPAETNFYRVLSQVLGTRGIVLMQVSLGQLVYVPGSNNANSGRTTWWNKLSRRSIDFLICNPDTLRPMLAIELDEPSHARPRRQQRDEEVEQALRACGLPLIRVVTSRSYSTKEIADCVLPHIGRNTR